MPLDNAAKIFPAVSNRELTSVVRISVELKEIVKARQLNEAIRAMEDRFPYYKVKLKAGFFWYYLEQADLPINITADEGILCREFRKDELMFRLLVKENRISVEFSHILTDGTGTLEFLKTLLLTYFIKCGYNVPEEISWHKPSDEPIPEEFEDSYNRYFEKSSAPYITPPKAFHVPFKLRKSPRFKVLLGVMSLKEIINKAKEFEVSLTEYLIAVYLFALQQLYEGLSPKKKRRNKKKIRIEVPVNLRQLYPSKSMRNFTLYVMPEIDVRMGRYNFEEIIKVVHHQMQLETNKKLLNKMISRHVGGEKNPFLRSVPLIFKSIVLSKLHSKATRKYSGVITNLGKFDLTPEVNKRIKRVVFIPPPANKILKINCGVVGFNQNLVLSFGNITISRELERLFFKYLSNQGISVKIEKY